MLLLLLHAGVAWRVYCAVAAAAPAAAVAAATSLNVNEDW
jgi:hypothetical protein